MATNVQYELAEAINEGLVYATIIETKEDTEMMTSSLQEIVKKFIVKSVAVDSESQEKIGGLEAQAVGILNYAQGVYHDRRYGVKIPLGSFPRSFPPHPLLIFDSSRKSHRTEITRCGIS